jgi:hypothetical protein
MTWTVVPYRTTTPISLQRLGGGICRIECKESTALQRRGGAGQLERVLGNCVVSNT